VLQRVVRLAAGVGPADARNLSAPGQPWNEIEYDGPEIDADPLICIDCGAVFVPNHGPGLPSRGPRSQALLRLQSEQIGLMDVVVTLTDDQLEAIAQRMAELLADQRASVPAPELLTVAQAAELAGVSVKTVRSLAFERATDPARAAAAPDGGVRGTGGTPGRAATHDAAVREDAKAGRESGHVRRTGARGRMTPLWHHFQHYF
jgi:hypothetical protein